MEVEESGLNRINTVAVRLIGLRKKLLEYMMKKS